MDANSIFLWPEQESTQVVCLECIAYIIVGGSCWLALQTICRQLTRANSKAYDAELYCVSFLFCVDVVDNSMLAPLLPPYLITNAILPVRSTLASGTLR
jgi:hypothetical protein